MCLETLTSLYVDTQTRIDELLTENETLKQEILSHEDYHRQVLSLTKDNEQLKRHVRELEDYSTQFSRVSHVVAMERENARLQSHIKLLERRIEIYQQRLKDATHGIESREEAVVLNEQPQELPPEKPEDVPEKSQVSQEQEAPIPSQIMREKKIKGIIYYISEGNEIHTKTEDGDVGECVGKLELLSSGKTKVKWFTSTSSSS